MTERFYPEVGSGGFTRRDGTIQFYQRVNALLQPEMRVLDFGAGRGASAFHGVRYVQALGTIRGKVEKVVGVDVDPIVLTNPLLDEGVVIRPHEALPFASESFDMIVSDFVFEHLEDPAVVCRDLDRILKPGGWICARTPNRHGYIAVGNRALPARLKDRVLAFLQPQRDSADVFIAYYRLNTPAAISRSFPGYKHIIYGWDSEPEYGSNRLTLRLFMLLHAVTPALFKTTLMVFLQKPDRVSPAGPNFQRAREPI